MDGRRLLEGLRRTAPDHDETVAPVLDLEVLDVGHERHGLVPFVGLGLDAGSFETAHPRLVEDGVHGDDTLEFLGDGGEILFFEHATGAGGLEGVGGDRVPAAEDDVVE